MSTPAAPYCHHAGVSTCVGQALTHSWQAVQCARNRSTEPAPGGQIGPPVPGSAGIDGDRTADFAGSVTAAAAASATNERRPASGPAGAGARPARRPQLHAWRIPPS